MQAGGLLLSADDDVSSSSLVRRLMLPRTYQNETCLALGDGSSFPVERRELMYTSIARIFANIVTRTLFWITCVMSFLLVQDNSEAIVGISSFFRTRMSAQQLEEFRRRVFFFTVFLVG